MSSYIEHRTRQITPENARIFKAEAKIWYESGIIPEELYLKIMSKSYCKIKQIELE